MSSATTSRPLPSAILVAVRDTVYALDRPGHDLPGRDRGPRLRDAADLRGRGPTCLATTGDGRAWCGTAGEGVWVSDDAGGTWSPAGLDGVHVMALTADPTRPNAVWAGTEPSAVWTADAGPGSWRELGGLMELPSAHTWSFPPRPDTHHVRWIACHPYDPGRIWVAVEAGALVASEDGGRTWRDRVEGSPYDTHELAIHPERPETLRVAAGDGYFESTDGGATWTSPMEGLEVGYLRSVAIDPADPEVVVVSASSQARTAYAAGHADGRVYRRAGGGRWERVAAGWPDPPTTIAPLLRPDPDGGLLAADERGIHGSRDGGVTWRYLARYTEPPGWLRGLETCVRR